MKNKNFLKDMDKTQGPLSPFLLTPGDRLWVVTCVESGEAFTSDMKEQNPEVWEWLTEEHKDIVANANKVFLFELAVPREAIVFVSVLFTDDGLDFGFGELMKNDQPHLTEIEESLIQQFVINRLKETGEIK